MIGCKFYTTSSLPSPYPGQYYFLGFPPSQPYIPYHKGFAAIYISGFAGLHIGLEGAEDGVRNKIYDMRNGIILRYAATHIYGTDFYSFEGGVPNVPGHPVLDLNQFGIHAYVSSLRIEDNTFENIMRCISLPETQATIHDNTLDIPTGVAQIASTRGITSLFPQALTITNNEITNGYKGIELMRVYTPLLVSENNLYREVPASLHVGIEVIDLRYSPPGGGSISKNPITIVDGDSATGIAMMNVTGLSVEYDTIRMINTTDESQSNTGISCATGGLNLFYKNDVISDSEEYEGFSDSGINIENSSNNRYFCNEMYDLDTLWTFVAMNGFSDIHANNFYNGVVGLNLRSPCSLGIQFQKGNQWLGDYETSSGFGGHIKGSVIETTVEN